MAKLALNQLEQATAVPDGSMYLVEMGDGSGTKTVTQEKLEERIGDALKVGNLDSLQTENKESLVDAINEAAQSGGGGSAVDILDTQEEIEANTVSGKSAGALGVKEMYAALIDNLKGFTPVLNETGEITGYKTTAGGADTVFPFRGSGKMTIPSFTVFGRYMAGNPTFYIPEGIKKISFDVSGLSPSAVMIVHGKTNDSYTSSGHYDFYDLPDGAYLEFSGSSAEYLRMTVSNLEMS